MNDLSPAIGASGRLSVDIADLYLHPLNTRSEPPPLDIATLAESILACGLMQNLLCFVDPDGGDGGARRMGVVAGGRRLRALQQLGQAGLWLDPVPVQFTTDRLQAQTWANAENTARAALHPADEIRAYGKMEATGASPLTIARAFAVTETHVKRRLRLAHLPARAIDALKAGAISYGQCAALTLSDDQEKVGAVLDILANNPNMHEDSVRRQMLGDGGIVAGDRRARFIGLDLYEAEGGTTTRDLFTDNAWLHDQALLDRIFARRLAEETKRLLAEGGWGFALQWAGGGLYDDTRMADYVQEDEPVIDLPEGDQEELDNLMAADDLDEAAAARRDELKARAFPGFDDEARARLGIMVHVNWTGKLVAIEGLRPRTAQTADGGQDGGDTTGTDAPPATTPEPDISQALREDFLTVRRAALQTALLLKPELTLDLVAFALDWAERHASYGITGIKTDPQNVTPNVAEGLTIVGALQPADRQDWSTATAADFRAFREQDGFKKRRNEILTVHFARSVMGIPGDLTDLLEQLAGAQVRSIWQPNVANCFGRLSSAALIGIYAELLRPEDGEERFAAFQAMKKRDQAKELDDLFHDFSVREAYGIDRETGARIDAWVPQMMRGAAA